MQYNETGHTATWQESCIEALIFRKYFSNELTISFHKSCYFGKKKNTVETSTVTITESYKMCCFDLYPINIFTKSAKGTEMQSYVHGDTLFFICYCLYFLKHFNYTLFSSSQYNFRSTAAIEHKCVANISWFGLNINCFNGVKYLADTSLKEENTESRQMTPFFFLSTFGLCFLHSLLSLKILKIQFPHLWFSLDCNLRQVSNLVRLSYYHTFAERL